MPLANRQTQQHRLSNLSPFFAVASDCNSATAQSSLIRTCCTCSWVPPRQNLRELVKGKGEKSGFRVIVSGKRVRPLDNPVDIVGDMLEEPFAITRFEIVKDLVNIGGGQPLRVRNVGHVPDYLPMAGFCRAIV